MSYVKHNTIVIIAYSLEDINVAREMAINTFTLNFLDAEYPTDGKKYVSEILGPLNNGLYSFFISPDGSKEGWDTSNRSDNAREEITKWLDKNEYAYVEVRFGGDDDIAFIVNDNEY